MTWVEGWPKDGPYTDLDKSVYSLSIVTIKASLASLHCVGELKGGGGGGTVLGHQRNGGGGAQIHYWGKSNLV